MTTKPISKWAAMLAATAAITLATANADAQDSAASSKKFPEGVTPTDVYQRIELLNRSVDVILKAKNINPPPPPKLIESNLGPMHVYQLQVACLRRFHEFELRTGLRPIPLVVTRPMKYAPADVKRLSDLLLSDLRNVAFRLKIDGLPEKDAKFSGKTPTDVFEQTVELFIKLAALDGQERITPSEVFSQLECSIGDTKSILSQIDPASRYRIDAPQSKPGLTPRDVFTQCLETRREINKVRQALQLGTTPVPNVPSNYKLSPVDVFVQTQILSAELNLLKLGTGNVSSTPLAVPVTGKSPTDTHQQATMVRYLVSQIVSVRNRTASKRSSSPK